MPTSQAILDGLRAIANGWQGLAIVWHVLLAAALLGAALGWRPGKRLLGCAVAAPLACVSAMAWLSGNPFNGTTFALLAVILVGTALRLPRQVVRTGPAWMVIAGGLLIAFGWAYPHFLRTGSWVAYLYAAPLGLIPCPTLSAMIGVALLVGGLESRAWSLVLAAGGAIYGLLGWLRLGVTIDVVLLAGAVILAASMFRRYRRAGMA